MSDPIALATRLDLSAASSLMMTLEDRKDDELIMDLAQVSHLGALCLQVMIAAATDARASGRAVSILNASERVIDQLRVMGMTPETISKGCV